MSEIGGLQELYSSALNRWPHSEATFFALGSWIVHFIAFWGLNALLYLVYHFNLFPKYKIQPAQRWPSRELVKKAVKERVIATIFIEPISWWLAYHAFARCGTEVSAPVPSATTFLWQTAVAFVINDFLFYWSHRLLHHPKLYRHIHKKHHEFYASIGIACEYAHPLEELLSNVIPTIIGPILLGSHPLVFWFYFFIRIWETVDAHSGYDFPFSPFGLWTRLGFYGGADFHDWHHSHIVGNFGIFRLWDRLFGTDAPYVKWQERGKKYGANDAREPVSPKANKAQDTSPVADNENVETTGADNTNKSD